MITPTPKTGLKEIKVDTRNLLEQLLESGRQLASQGQDAAEQRLGVPETGEQRDAMLSGAGKGALAAGALALLLGTGAGRKVTGSALKLGSLAAIGGVAYKAYQNWQSQSGNTDDAGTPVAELSGNSADSRSMTLLKAMISAAKADGHIDDQEQAKISEQIGQMGFKADDLTAIKAELEKPVDLAELAKAVDSPATAAEVYLASMLVLDLQNQQERTYLQQLARELKLSDDLVAQLEQQANA